VTPLGILNFGLLQWFFIRLSKAVILRSSGRIVSWAILCPVVPLTGWWSPYRSLGLSIRLIGLWEAKA
jgi:hypothetical protein